MSKLAMVVDDNDLVRIATSKMLKDIGYEVTEAHSGEAALDSLAAKKLPALVVTDYLMGDVSGSDLAWNIHYRFPAMKILVISGYTEEINLPIGVPILMKPFRGHQLASCLSLMLGA